MYRPITSALLPFALAGLLTACDSDDPVTGPSDTTPPTEITETFSGTLTVNGGVTNPFIVSRAGSISARLASLSVDDAIVGLSLGTWNGQVCQVILADDNARAFTVVIGNASAGNFCVRVYDAGKLTGPVDFEVTVTHF